MCFTLLLAEFGLRLIGYRPGQFTYDQWFHPVDSVYALKGFITDQNGILKVDTLMVNELGAQKKHFSAFWGTDSLEKRYAGDLLALLTEHWSTYPWYETYRENWRQNVILDDDMRAQLIGQYIQHPINQDGFYSIPFDTATLKGPRILLLGDSFTWGHSASRKFSSFSNILLGRGYNVLNTGISGADVQQYGSVLKAYYEELRPSLVVLNFFIGNDVAHFKRPVGVQHQLMYWSNAGNIYAMHNGVEFSSLESAYENVMRNMQIPATTRINRLMRKTVITTYLWEFMVNEGLIDHRFFVGKDFPEKDITNELLAPIISFCDSVHVPLIISVIPKLEKGKVFGAESVDGLFKGITYHQPQVSAEVYKESDGHFNDAGHLLYADHLQGLIDSVIAINIGPLQDLPLNTSDR
ncbi:MAG: hypothetical protein GC178_03305 [Flavobacteriales bacterium]|nr:hypothetical protein [Flavobacteriales bacterium]